MIIEIENVTARQVRAVDEPTRPILLDSRNDDADSHMAFQ